MKEEFDVMIGQVLCSKCGEDSPHLHAVIVGLVFGAKFIASPEVAHLCENCLKIHDSKFRGEESADR